MRSVLFVVFVTANIGGLMGLCMGFSLLSFFEFIYFFTMRWIFLLFRKKNRQNELGTELSEKDKQSAVFDHVFQAPPNY